MAQRQFLTSDTDKWSDRFGDGSDGDYDPTTSTDAPIDSACTASIGTKTISATNGSFAAGQLILVHQTRGTGAGQWELNKIDSYSAGTITTVYDTIFAYVSGAQVLVMPQYSSGLIDTGVTITVKAWNGTVGGIYAKFSNGTFTITNTLIGLGKGYRGGTGVSGATANYVAGGGEGISGFSGTGPGAQNITGGGCGRQGVAAGGDGGGGGGGYFATGSNGSGSSPGSGGSSNGIASLVTGFHLGGGGAAGGGGSNGPGGNGAISGVVVLIIAKTILVNGSLPNNGAVGESQGGSLGRTGGGGGSGGAILLKGQSVTVGSSLITATGGAGGTGTGGNGGAGSVGRIHIDYSDSISGTTNPTLDSSQDDIYADADVGRAVNYSFFM